MSLFSPEGKLIQSLSKIGNLIFLNIIYIFTCLPVITIGAASAALYATIRNNVTVKEYFNEFGKGFKKATLIWLIILASFALLAVDCIGLINGVQGINLLMLVCGGTLAMLGLLTFVWVYPMMARYDNSVGNYIKNSLIIAITKPGKTVLLLLLNLLIPFLAVAMQSFFFEFIVLILGIGFSGLAYLCNEISKLTFESLK